MYTPDLETDYQTYLAECRREGKQPVDFPTWLATIAQERIETDKIYRKQSD